IVHIQCKSSFVREKLAFRWTNRESALVSRGRCDKRPCGDDAWGGSRDSAAMKACRITKQQRANRSRAGIVWGSGESLFGFFGQGIQVRARRFPLPDLHAVAMERVAGAEDVLHGPRTLVDFREIQIDFNHLLIFRIAMPLL